MQRSSLLSYMAGPPRSSTNGSVKVFVTSFHPEALMVPYALLTQVTKILTLPFVLELGGPGI